jgi:hypothetical protein
MVAVQQIAKNRFFGEGETFFFDQQGAGFADNLIGPDSVRAIFGAGPAEQALGKYFAEPLVELAVSFTHGLDQPQLPAGYEGFFQGFYINRALGHAVAAFDTLPGFLSNF